MTRRRTIRIIITLTHHHFFQNPFLLQGTFHISAVLGGTSRWPRLHSYCEDGWIPIVRSPWSRSLYRWGHHLEPQGSWSSWVFSFNRWVTKTWSRRVWQTLEYHSIKDIHYITYVFIYIYFFFTCENISIWMELFSKPWLVKLVFVLLFFCCHGPRLQNQNLRIIFLVSVQESYKINYRNWAHDYYVTMVLCSYTCCILYIYIHR